MPQRIFDKLFDQYPPEVIHNLRTAFDRAVAAAGIADDDTRSKQIIVDNLLIALTTGVRDVDGFTSLALFDLHDREDRQKERTTEQTARAAR